MRKTAMLVLALIVGAWASIFSGNPAPLAALPRCERRRGSAQARILLFERFGIPLPAMAGGAGQGTVYPLVLYNPINVELPVTPLLRDNLTVNGTTTDMQGVDHICYLVLIGATDIVVDVKLQQGDVANGSDAADFSPAIAATQITATDDDTVVVLEASRQVITGRYVRPVVTIGNGTLGANVGVIALPNTHAGELPLTGHADILEHVIG